jgi:uncharacterized protein YecT (DUF1311 family)
MPIGQVGDPYSRSTYKGFAGAPGTPEPPGEPAPGRTFAPQARGHRAFTRALLGAAVVAALALGLAVGFLARPALIDRLQGAEPAPAVQPAPPASALAPIAVTPPVALAPPPQGKLEPLPPEMAAAERAPVRPHEPAASSGTPHLRASFDCAAARPGAEQMVCSDPALAAADRRMSHAYNRALAAGVDAANLRQEQQDWTAIREDAAQRSRRAVAHTYALRIAALNQMADASSGSDDEDDQDDEDSP